VRNPLLVLVKGSGMSGTVTWSILGPLIAAAGVAVAARGARSRAGGGDGY